MEEECKNCKYFGIKLCNLFSVFSGTICLRLPEPVCKKDNDWCGEWKIK